MQRARPPGSAPCRHDACRACISTAASCAALRPARAAPMPCWRGASVAIPTGKPSFAATSASPIGSFEQLVSQVGSRACEALGVARGDRVALLLGNGIAFPAVLFAALRLGAIAVPISIREQTPGLAYMLAHCGAKVLVHDADLARPAARAGRRRRHLAHRISVIARTRDGGLRRLLGAGRCGTRAAARDVDEEDTAVILYTSGTTGRPKGRDADPSRHLPLGHALRVLHGPHRARPVGGRRADEPRHRRGRADRRAWCAPPAP